MDYVNSLYHWWIHRLVSIVRFYVIAMNHLPCIALEDTLLLAWVCGEERTIEFMERLGYASSKTPLLGLDCEKGTVKHPFPMNYILRPWKLGQWFYQVVKFGIVQYMIIKLLTALLSLILEAFGVYCEGEF
ncbi:hypothetical protein Gorai_008834, partial [Gossypium raimondii]|nr:hypothetical protein [Gossypium raimondii]